MNEAGPHNGGEARRDDASRLERVEDRAAFTEHTVEQLNVELLRAFQTMERLLSRIEGIEGRLRRVEAGLGEGEDGVEGEGLQPPPHSASADERAAARRLDERDDSGV